MLMFCLPCPRREYCQSTCDQLEAELARLEKPLLEILKSPREFERLSSQFAHDEYFEKIRNSERELEKKEKVAERKKIVQELHRSFEYLTPRQMECIQLFYREGLTQRQIASQLGISQPTVTQHLQSAYTIIRKCLSEPLRTTYQDAKGVMFRDC